MKLLKQKYNLILVYLLIILTFTTNFSYAGNLDQCGFNCFTKRYEYNENTFCDVSKEWIKKSLKPSYELGLVSGRTSDTFDPNGFVTISEALSIAARIHEIYHGGDGRIKKIGSKWYDGAIIYAIDNHIIKAGQFSNYESKVTREEVADIFSHTLPQSAFTELNHITQLPDVTTTNGHYDSIMQLYNAGILSGSDIYGTFYPKKKITRAEISALLTRMVIPSERRKFKFLKKEERTLQPKEQTIKSKDGSFALTASSEWIENNPRLSSQSNLELSTSDGLCQFAAVTTKKKEITDFDLSLYNTACIEELTKKLNDPSFTPAENVTINGNNAMITEIKGNVENITMNYYIMVIENNTQIVLFSTVFPDSIAEESLPKVKVLYQQFSFIKEGQ